MGILQTSADKWTLACESLTCVFTQLEKGPQTVIEVLAALFMLLTNLEETPAAVNVCVVASTMWL